MSANPIWIAGYFGPVAGASPVWIAPGDGTVPSAVQSEIVSYYAPVAGATAVWIAGFFAPPPAAIGATPITISGWGGSGGGGPPPVTSVWSAADAAANGMTLSNGGLTVTVPQGTAAWRMIRNTISKASGKLYMEFGTDTGIVPGTNLHIGLASTGVNIASYLGDSNYSFGKSPAFGSIFVSTGFISSGDTTTVPVNSGDTFSLAVDFATGEAWVARNNTWFVGNPATEGSPLVTFTPVTVGPLFFGMSFNTASLSGAETKSPTTWTLYPTAASQKYAPPSGFTPWG